MTANAGSPAPTPSFPRMAIDGVLIDRLSVADTLRCASEWMREEGARARIIATINVQFLQAARSDARFREVLTRADLSVPDGVPIVWASKLLGAPLPERVNGTNLMVALCQLAAEEGRSVYLLGGKPGAAEGAAEVLKRRFPALRVAGTDCPPFGFEKDPALRAAVDDRIRQAQPDLLFAAFGAPKQEFWADEHRDLPVKAMLGVGGSFEMIAGFVRRAPVWCQNAGLEWLWRFAMEPGRLWKRYLVGNSQFVWRVGAQWLRQKLAGTTASAPEARGNELFHTSGDGAVDGTTEARATQTERSA